MTESVSYEQLQEAARARILARRDKLFSARRELKEQQIELVAKEQAIDRELADCRAAARFFDIPFDPDPSDAEIAEMDRRLNMFRMRARDAERRGNVGETTMYRERAAELEIRLSALLSRHAEEKPQPTLALEPKPEAATQPVVVASSVAAKPKIPKVREIALARLQTAGAGGATAASIRKYIETTYSTEMHEKTVGMTLWRLSKENPPLAHRIGVNWFFGPQAGQTLPARAENPGVAAPGNTHEVD